MSYLINVCRVLWLTAMLTTCIAAIATDHSWTAATVAWSSWLFFTLTEPEEEASL